MANRYVWEDDPKYERIIELLKAYWLEEPEELVVNVQMNFVKANGEKQSKNITWINPEYERIKTVEEDNELPGLFTAKSVIALFNQTAEDRERELEATLSPKNYRKITNN